MKNFLLSFILFFIYQLSFGQTTYNLAPEDGVKVSVKGNSTLHEWEAVASEITDYPATVATDLKSNKGFENFGFKVGVESLDGGRGASMNKKIKKALISNDHPNIVFASTSVNLMPGESANQGQIKSIGTLEIAGHVIEVEVDALANLQDDQLIISGSKALKMSDFGIEPPTAMFGQIKTRDDIVVHFEFRYVKE